VRATLGSAYGAVEQWIGTQGLEVAAAPREVYYTDYFAAAPADEVAEGLVERGLLPLRAVQAHGAHR